MQKHTAIMALAALAHDTRLEVFRLLVQTGHQGLAAGEIATRLGVLQNTMSAHLSTLAKAGLVQRERMGRTIRYRADYPQMQALLAFLLENCCQGDAGTCAPIMQQLAC